MWSVARQQRNSFGRPFTVQFCTQIRHLRNEKATGAEMRPAMVCGIVTEDTPVSYWLILFLCLLTAPDVFAKVNSTQFTYRFQNDAMTSYENDL